MIPFTSPKIAEVVVLFDRNRIKIYPALNKLFAEGDIDLLMPGDVGSFGGYGGTKYGDEYFPCTFNVARHLKTDACCVVGTELVLWDVLHKLREYICGVFLRADLTLPFNQLLICGKYELESMETDVVGYVTAYKKGGYSIDIRLGEERQSFEHVSLSVQDMWRLLGEILYQDGDHSRLGWGAQSSAWIRKQC